LKIERFAGLAAALVGFGVYLSTLAPGVTFWDSGELICGAVGLGIPHPPGYPVFCMLGKAFYYLPFGNAAYRMNLLSASFATATAYMLYRLVLEMLDGWAYGWALAASAALCFCFYPSFWGVSVITEVYTLNTLVLCLVVLCLYRYDITRRLQYLYMSSFLLALSLVVHQSTVFFLPAYVMYFLLTDGNYKRPAVLASALFFFMLAFSVTLYLPIRATTDLLINIGDPDYLGGMIWSSKIEEHLWTLEHLPRKFSRLVGMYGVGTVALGFAACAVMAYMFRKRGFVLMVLFAALSYFIGMLALTESSEIQKWGLQSKFYIPVVLMGVIAAAGLTAMIPSKSVRKSGAVACALALTLIVSAGGLAYKYYHNVDHTRDYFAQDFATNTLKAVKDGGALFGWGDNGVFPVWYLQRVEKYRDDVFFMHTELLSYPWYTAELQKRLYNRFGVVYLPSYPTKQYVRNIPVLRRILEDRTPTYFDFSALGTLKLPLNDMTPQGLIFITSAWPSDPLKRVWERYVVRGALNTYDVNRQFAAEGILDIYRWQAWVATKYFYSINRYDDGFWAFNFARALGFDNPEAEREVEQVRHDLASRKAPAQIRSK